MTTHKCDFCQGEIKANGSQLSATISYLPCFHASCQRCKGKIFLITLVEFADL